MKKILFVFLTVAMLIASASVVFGEVSNQAGYPGKCDNFTMWYTAGDTITNGMVVSIDFAYNAYTTGTYDTGSVCIRSQVENDTWVAGIAVMDALPEQSVKVQTRGVVAAKIDGSDSRSGVATIIYGYSLSTADRDGYLGSIDCDSSTAAAGTVTPYQQYQRDFSVNSIGFLVDGSEVATDDTGALTTYDVYIDVRSR
ncbi:MAG: hypothetical protein WC551_10630 [Patescibacteria group bacterium]